MHKLLPLLCLIILTGCNRSSEQPPTRISKLLPTKYDSLQINCIPPQIETFAANQPAALETANLRITLDYSQVTESIRNAALLDNFKSEKNPQIIDYRYLVQFRLQTTNLVTIYLSQKGDFALINGVLYSPSGPLYQKINQLIKPLL